MTTELLNMTQFVGIIGSILLVFGFLAGGVRGIYQLVRGIDKLTLVVGTQQQEMDKHKKDDLIFQKAILRLFGDLDINKALLIKVCARLKIDINEVVKE